MCKERPFELAQTRLIRRRGPFDPVCPFVSQIEPHVLSCRYYSGSEAELFPMHDRIAYQGITFDDVLLEPGYSDLLPHEVDTESQLTARSGSIFRSFPRRWTR